MTKVEELRKVILHDWWYESKAIDEVDSLIAAARAEGAEQERERVYAYADDPNNPYYSYDYSPDGFYLKASKLREFIKSGKEWVNPTHATPKRPLLSPAPKEKKP